MLSVFAIGILNFAPTHNDIDPDVSVLGLLPFSSPVSLSAPVDSARHRSRGEIAGAALCLTVRAAQGWDASRWHLGNLCLPLALVSSPLSLVWLCSCPVAAAHLHWVWWRALTLVARRTSGLWTRRSAHAALCAHKRDSPGPAGSSSPAPTFRGALLRE